MSLASALRHSTGQQAMSWSSRSGGARRTGKTSSHAHAPGCKGLWVLAGCQITHTHTHTHTQTPRRPGTTSIQLDLHTTYTGPAPQQARRGPRQRHSKTRPLGLDNATATASKTQLLAGAARHFLTTFLRPGTRLQSCHLTQKVQSSH
jgi:hypothetical protein